jgi:flagellar hook assembly protein FlgD
VGRLPVNVPFTFKLDQNYPNPFNPATSIRYTLPSQSRVKLQILDVLGQVVATLVDGEQSAGLQFAAWSANVSSGIYFYRMEAVSTNDPAKRFVDVKRMTLIK